jgi:hypothetical protein
MRRAILGISVILMLYGCSGKNSTSPTNAVPVAAILSAPAQNSICITGTSVSSTESSVTFTWATATNADNYDLYIKNLITATTAIQSNITATTATVTLLKGTPYSWYVVSKSSKSTTTAQSDTYKFYNAGDGVVSYAPFPATIVSPTFAQNITATASTITLTWTGTSVNAGTIASYDVYFGTSANPPIYVTSITNSFLNSVAVTSKTTYYWKIITRDAAGNTSDSGVYQFTVN